MTASFQNRFIEFPLTSFRVPNTPLAGGPVNNAAEFCRAALEVANVCLVQGSAFGCEGYVRLSFATSREQINAGVDKLAAFLKE